jgi:hypothetical protein
MARFGKRKNEMTDQGEANFGDATSGAARDLGDLAPPEENLAGIKSGSVASYGPASREDEGAVGDRESASDLVENASQEQVVEGTPTRDGEGTQIPTGNPTERAAIKRANFSRLAGGRVTRVLEGLRTLKNLANAASYEWDQDQHDKIFGAIRDVTKEVEAAFAKAKAPRVRSADRKQMRFEV